MSDKPRRPLYQEVGTVPDELDEESKRYYEALAQRIASRAERFTPAQLEMIEAFGFATGKPLGER